MGDFHRPRNSISLLLFLAMLIGVPGFARLPICRENGPTGVMRIRRNAEGGRHWETISEFH